MGGHRGSAGDRTRQPAAGASGGASLRASALSVPAFGVCRAPRDATLRAPRRHTVLRRLAALRGATAWRRARAVAPRRFPCGTVRLTRAAPLTPDRGDGAPDQGATGADGLAGQAHPREGKQHTRCAQYPSAPLRAGSRPCAPLTRAARALCDPAVHPSAQAGADPAEALRSTTRFIERQPRVSGTATQVLGRNLEALVDGARKQRDEAGDECALAPAACLVACDVLALHTDVAAAPMRRFVSSEHLLLALAKDPRFGSGAFERPIESLRAVSKRRAPTRVASHDARAVAGAQRAHGGSCGGEGPQEGH